MNAKYFKGMVSEYHLSLIPDVYIIGDLCNIRTQNIFCWHTRRVIFTKSLPDDWYLTATSNLHLPGLCTHNLELFPEILVSEGQFRSVRAGSLCVLLQGLGCLHRLGNPRLRLITGLEKRSRLDGSSNDTANRIGLVSI